MALLNKHNEKEETPEGNRESNAANHPLIKEETPDLNLNTSPMNVNQTNSIISRMSTTMGTEEDKKGMKEYEKLRDNEKGHG